MFKKTINFIKYHNAFVIIMAFVFAASFSALAASEDLREKVLGEEVITRSGMDNSAIMAADLDNFDLEMKILDVLKDDDNYYLDYQFKTYGIKDNIWQELVKLERMEVSKKSLDGRDLGLYAAEELGEVIDSELAYLKKVQENENRKGNSKIVQETKYERLFGLIVSTKTKELPPEYDPVVKPPVAERSESPIALPVANPPSDTATTPSPTAQCGSDNLDLCDTQDLCEANNLHWHSGQCNDDRPVIDGVFYEKLKELCEVDNLFWRDNACYDTCQETNYYLDADADGFGDSDNSIFVCELLDGYIDNSDDCDDNNFEINPDAVEICGSDIDENCDGIDDACEIPADDPAVPAETDEPDEPAEPVDVCDNDNLNLCDESNCETKGGFWYDDVCEVAVKK